jgi:glucan phosphoethanolaminetransferase (alkaline phosphatase superfamily)
VPLVIPLHLFASAAAASAIAWSFGQSPRAVAAHVALVAEWDLLLVMLAQSLAAIAPPRSALPRVTFRVLFGLTCTAQVYLYALDAVSNASWGRNITARIVAAFAPTVWSGKEPFPIGATGISILLTGTVLAVAATLVRCGPTIDRWLEGVPRRRMRAVIGTLAVAAMFGATLRWGIADRDNLTWKDELIASFFRPVGFAFEPTARREAVAARDARLAAAYPRHVPGARRRNVILIIVDSLRADHMQVYGYGRETTPFLAGMVNDGRMKKVDAAFSSCSESFCGITSTLASREFRDISANTFQLQDVLRSQGYDTWFLLSGNHRAWNGLPYFYHAGDDRLFDGSQTERYTVDDDRVVFEGLERVPAASPDRPAFFYVHLMSTHYLGVQFPESHFFTRPEDTVNPGLEPYKMLERLDNPDRYDDKVRQADGIIRDLFSRLREKHYLDDAIVVVTGDHGEGLGERHWAHGWYLYNEDMRIPMLIYDEPAAPYPDLSFATQVDIAPTIVDRLGLPIPASWEGRSLLAPESKRFTYHQTYFEPNRFAVLYRRGKDLFKFIATPKYGKEELYDLRHDGQEVRNVVAEQPAVAALLREKVRAYLSDQP